MVITDLILAGADIYSEWWTTKGSGEGIGSGIAGCLRGEGSGAGPGRGKISASKTLLGQRRGYAGCNGSIRGGEGRGKGVGKCQGPQYLQKYIEHTVRNWKMTNMTKIRELVNSEVERWLSTKKESKLKKNWELSGKSDSIADAIFLQLHGIAGPHLQGGPTPTLVASMILGESPYRLAKGELTKKEAHNWMSQTERATPLEWLWNSILEAHTKDLVDVTSPESIKVVRWLQKVMNNTERKEAMLRSRCSAFEGFEVEGSILARLDEIAEGDLTTSVTQTMQNAVSRSIKEMWEGDNQLVEPSKQSLPEGVEVIDTFSRLYAEGKTMRHCVASYAKRIASKEGNVISVTTEKGDKSTAWVSNGVVKEHRALANSNPTDSCIALLNQAMKSWDTRLMANAG